MLANLSSNIPYLWAGYLKSDRVPFAEEEKKLHMPGVSKLLFLMQFSYLNMLHMTRELIESMSEGETIDHKKILHQKMKYVIHIKK